MKKLFSSLRFHLLFPVILVSLAAVFTLTNVFSTSYTATLLKQENSKTASTFEIITDEISRAVQEDRKTTLAAMDSNELLNYAAGNFRTRFEQISARMDCLTYMEQMLKHNEKLYGFMFLRQDGSAFGLLPYESCFSDEERPFRNCPQIAEDILSRRGPSERILGPYRAEELYTFFPEDRNLPEAVMISAKRMFSVRYGTGYILTLIDASVFNEYMMLVTDNESRVYLLKQDGTLITSAGTEKAVSAESLPLLNSEPGEGRIVEVGGETFYTAAMAVPDTDWYLLRETPMAYYEQSVREIQRTVWLVAGLVFTLATVFYLIWQRRLLKAFDQLKAAIVATGEGRLGTGITKKIFIREFEEVNEAFNKMNQALQNVIEQKVQIESRQLETEMRNLQTQLSPHMIFNSITAIRWVAMMMGADKVSRMLKELSEMLQPMFRNPAMKWTFREELDHLSHYANLLSLRFGNGFSLDCEIPPEAEDAIVPRYTLQPLVENACEHGGADISELRVVIRARIEGSRLYCSVYNNGKDITEENLRMIRENLGSPQHRSGGIGLYNVYKRLGICMGQNSTMNVSRPEEGGTLVEISVPLQKEHEQSAPLPKKS